MAQVEAEEGTKAGRTVAEADLRLFIGPNAEDYIETWTRAGGHPFVWSWNWWGFLFPIPWLFYRKLWNIGSLLILVPALIEAITGRGTEAGLLLAMVIAALGKPLVLERGERKVRKVEALGLLSQDSAEMLRRAGGVSRAGAVYGAILLVTTLGLSLYRQWPASLPGCDDAVVQDTVLDIAHDNSERTGLEGGALSLDGIRQISGIGTTSRICAADLRAGGGGIPVEYEIVWLSRADGRYVVDLRLGGN